MRIVEEYNLISQPPENEIGIEIEMEGMGIPNAPIGWVGTPDGSLRGESLEYVLSSPVNRLMVKDMLEILASQFSVHRTRLNPSDRCGVHVHVNCQQLTTEQVINFALLYLLVEDLLVNWCGPTREGNLFCLRGKDAEALIAQLAVCKHNGSLRSILKDTYRYASMNLSSISKYGSVEFRALRTTTDFNKRIPVWVDALTSIKDMSLSYKSSRELFDVIKTNPIRFVENTLKGNASTFLVADSDRILKDALYRVQDVAYLDFKIKKSRHTVDELAFQIWNTTAPTALDEARLRTVPILQRVATTPSDITFDALDEVSGIESIDDTELLVVYNDVEM